MASFAAPSVQVDKGSVIENLISPFRLRQAGQDGVESTGRGAVRAPCPLSVASRVAASSGAGERGASAAGVAPAQRAEARFFHGPTYLATPRGLVGRGALTSVTPRSPEVW